MVNLLHVYVHGYNDITVAINKYSPSFRVICYNQVWLSYSSITQNLRKSRFRWNSLVWLRIAITEHNLSFQQNEMKL